MANKAKVVLTDYVWESLDVEKKILAGVADLVPLQTKKPDDFIGRRRTATRCSTPTPVRSRPR